MVYERVLSLLTRWNVSGQSRGIVM